MKSVMLKKIRTAEKDIPLKRKILYTALIFLSGAAMGAGSKALDETAVNELPALFASIDLTNFLGRFAIWIFIAVCISVYSRSAARASVNVFGFFAGMVGSYYLYSAFVAGFFPASYAMIWIGMTAVSPLSAAVCWYAKGKGWAAVGVSAVILGVLLSRAVIMFRGFGITHVPELVVWAAALFVLRRKPKEFAVQVAASLPVAFLIQVFIPCDL